MTAARRVLLLETPSERLLNRELMTFAIAVMQQCRSNEHVWLADNAEEAHLAGLRPSLAAVLAGDVAEACRLLQLLLYEGFRGALGEYTPEALGKVRPRALREALQLMATEERDLCAAAHRVATFCCSTDRVRPVTSAPHSLARYRAKPPQPEPMSSTR